MGTNMNEIKDIATPKRTREIMERHGLTVKEESRAKLPD